MVYVVLRMNKQKVTLSLDPDIYRRTRETLDTLPGTPSVSALVDELLDGFTKTAGPALAAVSRGVPPKDALTQIFAAAAAELVRIDEQEDEKPVKTKK
jgi:hypothetical protein